MNGREQAIELLKTLGYPELDAGIIVDVAVEAANKAFKSMTSHIDNLININFDKVVAFSIATHVAAETFKAKNEAADDQIMKLLENQLLKSATV